MKKIIVAGLALSLAGCASMPMSHRNVAPEVVKAPAPVITPAPVATPVSGIPVKITPLHKPRWYDKFRSAGSKFESHFKKGH